MHLHDAAHHATFVFFNDGTTEDIYSLVTQDNGGDDLNLFVIPASGAPYAKNGVPRREKVDYDDAGGGMTWHSAV